MLVRHYNKYLQLQLYAVEYNQPLEQREQVFVVAVVQQESVAGSMILQH
jgi:hypothetical protein